MGTTADKLNYLLETKEQIKLAISAKGVDVSASTFREYAQKISEIPQDVTILNPDRVTMTADVRFFDYDGSLLYSFTKEEFLSLAEFPASPTQKGLVFQSWNWSLTDAQEFVNKYGKIDIGATYITDDGKTRLYVTLIDKNSCYIAVWFTQMNIGGVTIDWGDGTEPEKGASNVSTSSFFHAYEDVGDYVITIDVAEGSTMYLGDGTSYNVMSKTDLMGRIGGSDSNKLKKVELGLRTKINRHSFRNCRALKYIVLPNGTEYPDFTNCNNLKAVVVPKGATALYCDTCHSLSVVSLPKECTNPLIAEETALSSLVIPNGGGSTFGTNYALSSITFGDGVYYPPDFKNWKSLLSVTVPPYPSTGSPYIRESMFSGCEALTSVILPQNIATIYASAFKNCYCLSKLVFPSACNNIRSYTFENCGSLEYIDFRNCTSVVSLEHTNAFSGVNTACKFIVPDELYDTWIAAINWTTYADYIVKASEYQE